MRFAPLRRLPNAYGWLIKRDFDDAPTRDWVDPSSPTGGSAATRSRSYGESIPSTRSRPPRGYATSIGPALLAWAVEDRFFKLSFAERLAATIQGATLERIEDSYTFVSEDQPERLAELIARFARVAGASPPDQQWSVRSSLTFRPSSELATASSCSPEDGVCAAERGCGGLASLPTFLPRR